MNLHQPVHQIPLLIFINIIFKYIFITMRIRLLSEFYSNKFLDSLGVLATQVYLQI